MYAFSFRINLGNQRIGIRATQLGELPPVDHASRQIMPLCRQSFEHIGTSTISPRFGLFAAFDAHFIEQDFTKLLGRCDIEFPACELVNFLGDIGRALFKIA